MLSCCTQYCLKHDVLSSKIEIDWVFNHNIVFIVVLLLTGLQSRVLVESLRELLWSWWRNTHEPVTVASTRLENSLDGSKFLVVLIWRLLGSRKPEWRVIFKFVRWGTCIMSFGIALSTSLFRSVLPPIIDLTHCTETKQLRPLNNRQCRFDNGFNVVQNRRPCSLSGGTSNGTTPSSHRTFSSSGRRPVPKNNPIFPVRPGLIRPPGLTGPRLRLTSACQSGCLQSTVVAFPS